MRLYSSRLLSPIVVTALGIYLCGHTASALTFEFSFDNDADSEVTPPLVGSGFFHFDGDPGDGSFALNDLENPAFSASFRGDTFDLADSEDPLSEVLAVIFTEGPNRFLRFGNINGVSGGEINGAIDFFNDSNQFERILTFSPGLDGDGRYATAFYFGDYVAVAVIPEPATLLIFVTGVGIATLPRRRKHQPHPAGQRNQRGHPAYPSQVCHAPDSHLFQLRR